MPRKSALRVVRDAEPPHGDEEKKSDAMSQWTREMRICRLRGHLYAQVQIYVYGRLRGKIESLKDIPIGTRMDIVERCSRCRCVFRHADHIRTPRGVRMVEDKWKPDYRDHEGVAYLLPKGSGRLDDGDREELGLTMYDGRRFKVVDDEDE